MKKVIRGLAVAIGGALILTGCSKGQTDPAAGKPAEQAKDAVTTAGNAGGGTEDSFVVYNASQEEEMVILLNRFEEESGIHGETVRLSAGEALGRITVEQENPKAGVWYGGGIDSYIQAKEQGLLEPYFSPTADGIPAEYKDPEGYFTGAYLTYLVIAYNNALLEEKGVEPPKSWQDLLDPVYEGQITMANPGSSGTAYTFLSTMCQLYGEEEGMEFMKKLNPNIKSYEKSGSAPSRLAAQGEAMIAITYLHDVISYQDQGFKDLMAVIPEEGTGYEIGCVALIKGGPDPEASKKFIDFVLQPESQVVQDELGYCVGHTHPDATLSKQIEAMGDFKLIDYDAEWAGSNRNRLVEEWSAMVGE